MLKMGLTWEFCKYPRKTKRKTKHQIRIFIHSFCFCQIFIQRPDAAKKNLFSSSPSKLLYLPFFLCFHVVSVLPGHLTELRQLLCQTLPFMEISLSSKCSSIYTELSAAKQWNNLILQVTAEVQSGRTKSNAIPEKKYWKCLRSETRLMKGTETKKERQEKLKKS